MGMPLNHLLDGRGCRASNTAVAENLDVLRFDGHR